MKDLRLSRLPGGAVVLTAAMPHLRSVSVGIWAGAGGRHETARLSGISHFLEHMLFKGTRRRTAKEISEAIEGVGGYLNAFTTEDHTCYYAHVGADRLGLAVDVLGDMVTRSVFDPAEVERERQVIREELYAAVASVLAFVFSLRRGEKPAMPRVHVPAELRFDATGRLDANATA